MKRLYVSDLDGTLLNSQEKVSDFTVAAINKLVNQGMIFTYATARSLVSAKPITKGLTKKLPLIIYNGAFIVSGEDGKIIYKNNFNHEQINLVKNILEHYSINPMVYAIVNDKERVTIVNDHLHPGTLHYLSKRTDDYRMNLTDDYQQLYQGDIFYFTVIDDKERLEPIYQHLKQYDDFNLTFQQEIYRQEYWLEIMPKSASKAHAILELKKILGCDEIISFGDAINDIPMFKISNQCYAMANAVDQLKEIATDVILSNDEDGVARWLLENYR